MSRMYESPIDLDTTNNLEFLIGIRNEIEHQMTGHLIIIWWLKAVP